jgi:hypothetical protein
MEVVFSLVLCNATMTDTDVTDSRRRKNNVIITN